MRWGSDGSVAVPLALGQFASQQLIRVDCVDLYTRNWQVIGNVAATNQFWNVSAANLTLGLEVSMGGGQANLVQVFDLRAITDALAPWYVNLAGDADDDVVVKPFVISCAVLGKQFGARVVCNALNAVILEDPQTVRATVVTSPYAAGFGL